MDHYNKTVLDIIRWGRIGSISCRLAERLNTTPLEALKKFYRSEACRRFHDRGTGLYLFSDLYIVDEYLIENNIPLD